MSCRAILDIRAGKGRPHRKNREEPACVNEQSTRRRYGINRRSGIRHESCPGKWTVSRTYQELIYLEAAQWFNLKVCVAEENRNRSSSAAFNSAPVLA